MGKASKFLGRTVTLASEDLLSKWGFGDGDVLFDPLWDMAEERREVELAKRASTHPALIRAVREYLLPALHQRVEVYELGTLHNPIRAKSVDGVDVPSAVMYGEEEPPFRIVCGWNDEAMAELASQFRWDAAAVARLKRLHAAFEAAG